MSRQLTPIGHCSKKLRRKLEIEEEMALAWRIKVRRPKSDDEVARGVKGGRWFIESNLAVPGPFWHRPISPEGHVSFHFAWTTVSKSSSGKSVVADSRGKVSETDRTPADHDRYVARDGAVMTIGPADFDRYTARDNVTDLTTGKPEVALMSNISLDPAVRATFWNAVHATARKAGPDRLVLDPSRGTKKEWSALAAADDVSSDLRNVAAQFASGERKRKAEFTMTEVEAKATIELINRFIPRADRKKGPIRFARGRKGRTQYRLEVELPDGIDAAARVRIMIRVAEAVEAAKAMYTLALHAPDEHNDERNYHLHVVAHDRPARLIDGQWDFTISTPVEGQSGRVNFKDRSRKVVIPSLMTSSNRGDFEAFLKDLRGRYADFCNEELRKAGQTRLFDPRRYSEMGIDRKPTKALGSRLAPLEAAGVPTKVGTDNAEIIWSYELQAGLRRCDAKRMQRDQIVAHLRASADRHASTDADSEPARAALRRATRATAFLDVAEPELAEYEVTLAMARARPAKVVHTCSRILTEIETGRGSSSDRRNRGRIKDRLHEATTFLSDIERIDRANQRVIAEQQPMIDQARRDIAAAAEFVFSLLAGTPHASQTSPGTAFTTPPIEADIIAVVCEPADTAAQVPESAAASSKIVALAAAEPATPQSDLSASLEATIARIKTDRLIVLGPEHHEGEGYRVSGVTRDELRVLRHPDVAARAQAVLAHIADDQVREIKIARMTYRFHGNAHAEEMSANNCGRPSTINDPLGVLRAYRDHPLAASLMGWSEPGPERSTGKTESIWRRMRTSVAGAFSGTEFQRPAAQPNYCPADLEALPSSIAPQSLARNAGTASSLEEAISKYAKVIRTDPNVRLIMVEGERRVDPCSIPDWERSVHAFEDNEAVKTAIKDRGDEEGKKAQEAECQLVASEKFRASKRAQILAALSSGEVIARRGKNGWVVEGRDEDLAFVATRWKDHPQLEAAFKESEARQLSGGTQPLGGNATRPLPSQVHQPALPAAGRPAAQATPTSSPASAPAQIYTLDELQWIRNQRSGQAAR